MDWADRDIFFEELWRTVHQGNVQKLNEMWAQIQILPDAEDIKASILRVSIQENNLTIIRYLLEKGISPNTILDGACYYKKDEVVQFALDAGADVNITDSFGNTLLWSTSESIMRLLIAKGVNVNKRNKAGYTAIMRAAQLGDLDIVRFLMSIGAQVTNRDYAILLDEYNRVPDFQSNKPELYEIMNFIYTEKRRQQSQNARNLAEISSAFQLPHDIVGKSIAPFLDLIPKRYNPSSLRGGKTSKRHRKSKKRSKRTTKLSRKR